MKILLVNKYWFLKGGAERVVFLTKELLEAAGHEVEIFGMHHEKNIFDREFFVSKQTYTNRALVNMMRQASQVLYNKEAKARFAGVIKDFRPDVIHFHNIYHQLSYSLVDAGFEQKIPMVMTLHDYKMLSPNYTLFHHGAVDESMLGQKYYRCVLNNCMEGMGKSILATLEAYVREGKKIQEKIDAYIAPSTFMKTLCQKAGWEGGNIRVIYNPLEMIPKKSYKEEAYVAYTGRLSPEKGVECLLQAAQKTPEISYKIAGSGPSETKLRRMARYLELKNVEFLGWLEGKELERCIGKARFLVVPSVWYENAPYSVLRPQGQGKLVIGSDIGGIPELLPKNCLFEPKNVDSLVKKIRFWYGKSEQKRAEIGKKFQEERRTVNDPQAYLSQLLQTYTELL